MLDQSHKGRLQVLLLAAGLSSRMGVDNKLTLNYKNKPIIRQVAENILASGIGRLTVVTGHEHDLVEAALSGLDLDIIFNDAYQEGQMSSVRFGTRTLLNQVSSQSLDGLMIALGDMPFLMRAHYRELAGLFETHQGKFITIPFALGQRGNPIILPENLLQEVADGSLNAGCRKLIETHGDKVLRVDVACQAYIRDIDTPIDYQENIVLEGKVFPTCC